ncbi:similar to Saccharomyces cerevisiae YHR170W NMD3 Protein involved in nuclear export of the large ribosomal subunit [Maudiozyma saulgeensis]|uniref:60S ribosomal export protein NMD3 n=1 Tax=Maudiozyma saulgeensis TaxID=1789683 RepID=A0A1X7RA93_9SACH|nr:similar to Saccharomyces cerevisiae YHR170W NMD3 Protein involved in nuclear export of the large ribosomal subunit [Kazachstania saulgeensis]
MSVNVKDEIASKPRATMLCCECGTPIDGSKGLVMCYDCIKMKVDITEGIPRESNISFCRDCERFLQPPGQWIRARLESRELLAICLKKLKGLNKVRLIDASFIWTEPHSRRIKVRITVQGEAMLNTLIQQSFEVEYFVNAMQCADCAKSYTANTWTATVQIRQKVPHKRTFLYLEQMILKNNAHVNTVSIKEVKDGLDFFYGQKNHAIKMVDFLTSSVPAKYKRSEELISQDSHTDVSKYKFTYSVELVPICKDDLVVLPKKIAKSLGNISQFVLCHKISNFVQFLDPKTLQTAELAAPVYWRNPFSSLADSSQLVEFIVLDVESTGTVKDNRVLADITVARAVDLGVNDQEYYIRSHLGGVLHAGDSAMGYFIANSNYNSDLFDELKYDYVPDVVLVKKLYPKRAKSKRNWKLKRMAKEHNDIDASKDYNNARVERQDFERAEKDYEMFLQELEEDSDLRNNINMYKSAGNEATAEENEESADDTDDIEENDVPGIDMDELLDEIDGLALDDPEDAEAEQQSGEESE